MTARVVISQEVALGSLVAKGTITGVGITPTATDDTAAVLAWLARLRLLDGVPFEYLVPDAGLLQPETIRFFHIDRNWTDAAVDGALAAGAYGTRDRAEIQEAHAAIRAALDDEERTVWGTTPTSGSTPEITGFLLRSRAVSGWPGMIIRGFTGSGRAQRQLQPLRIERLSPSVLIVLFDDEPTALQIEEPRQGIQFGLRGHDTNPGQWVLPLRDDDGEISDDEVAAPFRRGSAGVLHLTELRKRMADELEVTAGDLNSADVAYHLLRKPYRQDFGTESGGDGPTRFDELLKVVVDPEMILGFRQ